MTTHTILDAVIHVLIFISLGLSAYRIRCLEKEVERMRGDTDD